MARQECPKDRLLPLIQGELSPEESSHILTHLEDCSSCQSELETRTADPTWWKRTARGLSGVAVDASGHLPEADRSVCSVEALFEVHGDVDPPSHPSNAVLAMLDPPVHPETLGRIDEFDIEEKIGQGGMGIVFRGFDRSLNRPVAIKVMAPHLGADDVARKRFAREAQAAAAIVHPHVVPIYRVNSSSNRPYIAMALVDGGSLQDHVSRNGHLDAINVVRVSIQIADGLAAAHRQGLIHRDIKPANILMAKDVTHVMITDFGLARAVDDVAMTKSGCLAGTPHYMSPEQVKGVDIDHRSDLFSLGAVMYFMVTGREPFRSENAFGVINKVTREAPTPARKMNPDVPEMLDRIIGRLLEKTPSDRIESADDLQQLLTEYLAHLHDPERHAQPQLKAPRSQRTKLRKRIGWGCAAIVLLLTLWWAGFFAVVNPYDRGEHHGTDMHNLPEEGDHHDADHREEGGREEHGRTDSHDG